MKAYFTEEGIFRLPNELSDFQKDMYIHLIKWKWKNLTEEAGIYKNEEYDAILPKHLANMFVTLYPDIKEKLISHHKKYPFRLHKHFNHMASSQAAIINLFLPILYHPHVDKIFSNINPNYKSLAKDQLDNGYRLEFWDEPYANLKDKTTVSGTDSDIAIAYYNHDNELSLWLIEHKLTEKEFTYCGGYSSKGKKDHHFCNAPFADILANKSLCYYHDIKNYKYWDITERNQNFLKNHSDYDYCPFDKGMNQLWRNQLLALSIAYSGRTLPLIPETPCRAFWKNPAT
jgi:hypothetical protein